MIFDTIIVNSCGDIKSGKSMTMILCEELDVFDRSNPSCSSISANESTFLKDGDGFGEG